ncbi:hypothetical protein BDZ91DRAFT_280263 [Kalaharituber pfeilii]|nr:hypothetical protein BDZ91DRAFT_280263 [Kalaharituber pfeilii]
MQSMPYPSITDTSKQPQSTAANDSSDDLLAAELEQPQITPCARTSAREPIPLRASTLPIKVNSTRDLIQPARVAATLNSRGSARMSLNIKPATVGPQPSDRRKNGSQRNFTKPPTLPPLDLGASIGGIGLERTVKRMEIQLRRLEIQFERFKRAHIELMRDYDDLESFYGELGSSFEGDEKEGNTADKMASGEFKDPQNERIVDADNVAEARTSSGSRKIKPIYIGGRSVPHGQACVMSPSSSTSERGRQISQTRSLPSRFRQTNAGARTQQGINSRKLSTNGSVHAARKTGSIPRTRSRSSESPHSRMSPGQSRPNLLQRSKPRTLPQRMISTQTPPKELLRTSELGSTYAAFPRWSNLGLDTMETFKIAQGPSTMRKWKNGKPPIIAV